MLSKKEMPKKLILKVNIENISRRSRSRIAEKQNLLIVIKASVAFLATLVMYYSVSFLTTEIFVISNKRTYDLLTKRDYFQILVIALADILGTFILVLIADKFRRKTLLTIYFTLVGIILTGYMIPFFSDYATFISALGRFIAAPLNALAWVYIAVFSSYSTSNYSWKNSANRKIWCCCSPISSSVASTFVYVLSYNLS